MTNKIREQLIAGNWKMYKSASEAVTFIKDFTPLIAEAKRKVYLAVPFTAISEAAKAAEGTSIVIGAQNMNDATEGAFTGEISAKMLISAGAKFVILGHSERRQIFGETDEFINKKIKRALTQELQPIFCIGETAGEREAQHTEQVIKRQLAEGLKGISSDEITKIVIAYEPVWAIGSGLTATPEMAEEVHQLCRKEIASFYSEEIAEQMLILYGGSAKPENAAAILEQPDIDGLLVGGASLSPETFAKIVNS